MDRVEKLALQRLAVDSELAKRALQLESETWSEGRLSLPGEPEALAADAAAATPVGPVAVR